MSLAVLVLMALIAVEHLYFLVLEMFLWTKPLGLKVFRNSPDKAAASAVLQSLLEDPSRGVRVEDIEVHREVALSVEVDREDFESEHRRTHHVLRGHRRFSRAALHVVEHLDFMTRRGRRDWATPIRG